MTNTLVGGGYGSVGQAIAGEQTDAMAELFVASRDGGTADASRDGGTADAIARRLGPERLEAGSTFEIPRRIPTSSRTSIR